MALSIKIHKFIQRQSAITIAVFALGTIFLMFLIAIYFLGKVLVNRPLEEIFLRKEACSLAALARMPVSLNGTQCNVAGRVYLYEWGKMATISSEDKNGQQSRIDVPIAQVIGSVRAAQKSNEGK